MDNIKKNDRRISIVLNGKEKTYDELEKDKQAYEEVLNQEITATEEISATQEKDEHDEFPWLLSDNTQKQSSPKIVDLGERRRDKSKLEAPYWDDGKSERSPKLPHIKRKKKKRFEFNFNLKALPLGLIGIVMSAIIVGVSFGFMMLTIFTGEANETSTPATNPVQAPVSNEVPPVAMKGEIPVLGVEVVQGGAFSQVETGDETAQIIKENGFAATLAETSDRVYLFIGLGLDREQARVIGDIYDANGQEVYLKPYAVSANGIVENDGQASFLQTGVDLYQQITLLSVNGFANGGSLYTEKMLSDLTAIHDEFLVLVDAFSNNEVQQPLATAFQSALIGAYDSLQNFISSNSEADLWQVQQHLLNGLTTYEQLITTL